MTLGLALLLLGSPIHQSAWCQTDPPEQTETASEPIRLRWKFESGQTFSTTNTTQSVTNSETLQRKVVYDDTVTIVSDWTVEQVSNDGVATFVQTVRSIRLDSNRTSPTGAISRVVVDSNEKPGDKVAKAMLAKVSPTVGLSWTWKVDSRGNVLACEPVVAEDETPETRSARQLASQWTDQSKSGFWVVLPEEAVREGSSWTTTWGDWVFTMTVATLGSDGQAVIQIESQRTDNAAATAPSSIEGVDTNITAWTSNAEFTFDTHAGRPITASTQSRVATKLEYRDMEITVDAAVESEIQWEVKN